MRVETVALLVAMAAAGGAATLYLQQRHELIVEHRDRLEVEQRYTDLIERMESKVTVLQTSAKDFESRISVTAMDVDALVRAVTRMQQPTRSVAVSAVQRPAETAHWWCFLGRDCYRERSQCIGGDDGRAVNCKASSDAYCAPTGRCFGDMMTCLQTIDVTVSTCTRAE